MSNKWITSDTHYHHKNVVRGCSTWPDSSQTRNFNTLDEHDDAIVNGINKYVKEDDYLYHLGDWSFGGIEQIWNFRKRINCKNIILILGNHDHHIENNREIKIHSEESFLINKLGICDDDERFEGFFQVPIRNIFSSVQHILFDKLGKETFFISHFPHRSWNGSTKGVIHLYGHEHDQFDKDGTVWGKSMDCGVDSAFRFYGEYRPFHINDIYTIMDKR